MSDATIWSVWYWFAALGAGLIGLGIWVFRQIPWEDPPGTYGFENGDRRILEWTAAFACCMAGSLMCIPLLGELSMALLA